MFRRFYPIILAFGVDYFSGGYARAQAPSSQPDLGKLAEEAQGWLADMVRINTSNPPGNEMAVAKYISGILQKEGIPNEVVEITPGRGVAIGRLQAGPTGRGECAAARCASGHRGRDPTKWSWTRSGSDSRGLPLRQRSIDDKAMLAANLAIRGRAEAHRREAGARRHFPGHRRRGTRRLGQHQGRHREILGQESPALMP